MIRRPPISTLDRSSAASDVYKRQFQTTIKKFETNEKIFGITFAQKEKDGTTIGKNKLFWNQGLLQHTKADNLIEGETGWVEGGSSIIRKDLYEQIGGFDSIFSPFYWEDIEPVSYTHLTLPTSDLV